jgi:hypothetical protein
MPWDMFNPRDKPSIERIIMSTRISYYKDLSADLSLPGLVKPEQAKALVRRNAEIQKLKEPAMPAIDAKYTVEQIMAENKEWFPTHCTALREGRFDLLGQEYRQEYVYLCQDGPFYGHENDREKHWVAIIAQPGVVMAWPIVQFHNEVVYFEWHAMDEITHEIVAKGNVTFLRRGHRGAIYLKTEQLTFYRDVYASEALLSHITE